MKAAESYKETEYCYQVIPRRIPECTILHSDKYVIHKPHQQICVCVCEDFNAPINNFSRLNHLKHSDNNTCMYHLIYKHKNLILLVQ